MSNKGRFFHNSLLHVYPLEVTASAKFQACQREHSCCPSVTTSHQLGFCNSDVGLSFIATSYLDKIDSQPLPKPKALSTKFLSSPQAHIFILFLTSNFLLLLKFCFFLGIPGSHLELIQTWYPLSQVPSFEISSNDYIFIINNQDLLSASFISDSIQRLYSKHLRICSHLILQQHLEKYPAYLWQN